MNLKQGFDDEFRPKVHKPGGSIRSIGLLIIVAATCGVAVSVMAGVGKQKRQPRVSASPTKPPVKIRPIKAPAARPGDPFVVVAPAEIDPQMVVAAPVGLDEAMVFNPDDRGQNAVSSTPAPGSFLVPFPGNQPGMLPGDGSPMYPPLPTQPR